MKPKKPTKKLNSFELSRQLSEIGRKCAPSNIRAYLLEGAPANSAKDFLLWLEEHHPTRRDNSPELKKLRMEKLQAEIRVLRQTELRAERRNAKESDELVSAEIVSQGISIAVQTFFASLKEHLRDLPSVMVGRDELFIRNTLDAREALITSQTREAFQLLAKEK